MIWNRERNYWYDPDGLFDIKTKLYPRLRDYHLKGSGPHNSRPYLWVVRLENEQGDHRLLIYKLVGDYGEISSIKDPDIPVANGWLEVADRVMDMLWGGIPSTVVLKKLSEIKWPEL